MRGVGSNLRLVLSAASFSGWLTLLLLGHAMGGANFAFLVAAVLLFPWRVTRTPR